MQENAEQKPKPWWQTMPALITAVAGLIAAITGMVAVFHKPSPDKATSSSPVSLCEKDKQNLVQNCGFENGLALWGTGYYETDVYKGSLGVFWASRVGMVPARMEIANVRGEIDSSIRRSGTKSFKITNDSSREANIYGTMSQRVTGLMKNTDYLASFWVKTERAKLGTFEITTDLKWLKRKHIDAGTYDWQEFSAVFNTGDYTFIDLRIISEEPGTVWVDDITLKRYFPTK